jgi:pantothenate kinase
MQSIAELVERASSLVPARATDNPIRRALLGITGPPGAGKSTLADRLSGLIGSSARVGLDGFHIGDSELRRQGLHERKGAPETFDRAGFAQLLLRLRAGGEAVYVPVFHRSIEDSIAAERCIQPDQELIIVEGNYLLNWPEVAAMFDEVWYLDPARDDRVGALIARHVEFGKTADEASEWVHRSDERNAAFVARCRGEADLVPAECHAELLGHRLRSWIPRTHHGLQGRAGFDRFRARGRRPDRFHGIAVAPGRFVESVVDVPVDLVSTYPAAADVSPGVE